MKSLKLSKIVIFTLILSFQSYSQAALLSTDWKVTNDNLITRDTNSGLDWLDLSVTLGMSYNEIFNNTIYLDYGFRFATEVQLTELFTSVGITSGAERNYLSENYIGAYNLVDLMDSRDHYFDIISSPGQSFLTAAAIDINELDKTASVRFGNTEFMTNDTNSNIGFYLVRKNDFFVPIPPSIFLFLSGLLGLYSFIRRK